MNYRSFIILLTSFFVCFAFQGGPDMSDTITWSAKVKLTWNDFEKILTDNTMEAATTEWGIYISQHPRQANDTIYLDIHAFFMRNLSSKKEKKERLTDNVLDHEQGHFDIAEVHARILRKDLEETRFTSVTEFFKNVQAMYNKEMASCRKEQAEYDKETNHSMNAEGQAKWDKKIADEIAQYSAYSNTQLKLVVGK